MMNKLALYVFPLGVVVGGPFLPLAILLYWFSNNIWTFGQQHYVFGKIEKEEEAKKQEALERRAANAPAPGAKPSRKKGPRLEGESVDGTDGVEFTQTTGSEQSAGSPNGNSGAGTSNGSSTNSSDAAARNGTASRTPKPGARPKQRKR